METRNLGTSLTVSAIGIGCMPMAGGQTSYGAADRTESIATIHRAIELGVTLFDTAELYGPYAGEELLGHAVEGRRGDVVLATKFGFKLGVGGSTGLDGSPANARRACDASLSRLRTDYIDLFYLHRVDPNVPVEDTVGAMADLVAAGKVRAIGLSEVGPQTIRRAHSVHPIAAVQSEYSLWERGAEADVFPVLRELAIGFVPFSPLGRGFLTGSVAPVQDLPASDYRRKDPRYSEQNFPANQRIVGRIAAVAQRHGVSLAQIALAWILAQGADIVPIPGSKRRATMTDSAASTLVELVEIDLQELHGAAAEVSGARYANDVLKLAAP